MKKWICLGLLFVAFPGWALAREEAATGTLTGFVLSTANGNLLPGVSVSIELGGVQEKTDLDEMFNVALVPGEYVLKLTLEGYVSQTVRGVEIVAGKETPQDIPLSPVSGVTSETVEVFAQCSSTSSTLSDRLSRQPPSSLGR